MIDIILDIEKISAEREILLVDTKFIALFGEI